MAEEKKMLRDVIQDAVSEHLSNTGGGFIDGFVFCGSYMDEDGENMLMFTSAKDQRTTTSLGMIEMLKLNFTPRVKSVD